MDPFRWKKPKRVFVNSMSDLFHEKVPDWWLDCIFATMALCPQHTFQVLTKRPQRMFEYCENSERQNSPGRIAEIVIRMREAMGYRDAVRPLPWLGPGAVWYPLANVWLGVSVEDQRTADERIPFLLQTPAAVRWVSYEPALGPVRLDHMDVEASGCKQWCWINALTGRQTDMGRPCPDVPQLNWVVAGGESGPGARPAHPDWFRAVRDQCQAAHVPFFFKQWGEWSPERPDGYVRLSKKRWSHESFAWAADGSKYNPLNPPLDHFPATIVYRVGKRSAGRLLDSREWSEFPISTDRLDAASGRQT